MKSDVLPMIEAGGWGVFVPHGFEWALESAAPPDDRERFATLEDLGGLGALVARIG
jgi:putative hydrolase of the HAD superfamily